jgi:uncharacterized protein (DUF39 family)
VTYEQLRSGAVEIQGRRIKTAPMSSLLKARRIADELKKQIEDAEFFLTNPVSHFPEKAEVKPLKQR